MGQFLSAEVGGCGDGRVHGTFPHGGEGVQGLGVEVGGRKETC